MNRFILTHRGDILYLPLFSQFGAFDIDFIGSGLCWSTLDIIEKAIIERFAKTGYEVNNVSMQVTNPDLFRIGNQYYTSGRFSQNQVSKLSVLGFNLDKEPKDCEKIVIDYGDAWDVLNNIGLESFIEWLNPFWNYKVKSISSPNSLCLGTNPFEFLLAINGLDRLDEIPYEGDCLTSNATVLEKFSNHPNIEVYEYDPILRKWS